MTNKTHVYKAVTPKMKEEVRVAASAAGLSESAYLAGCITYVPAYMARQAFLAEQRRGLARVRRMWYMELLALRNQPAPQTQIEYIGYSIRMSRIADAMDIITHAESKLRAAERKM